MPHAVRFRSITHPILADTVLQSMGRNFLGFHRLLHGVERLSESRGVGLSASKLGSRRDWMKFYVPMTQQLPLVGTTPSRFLQTLGAKDSTPPRNNWMKVTSSLRQNSWNFVESVAGSLWVALLYSYSILENETSPKGKATHFTRASRDITSSHAASSFNQSPHPQCCRARLTNQAWLCAPKSSLFTTIYCGIFSEFHISQ